MLQQSCKLHIIACMLTYMSTHGYRSTVM
jgi:hypothetical protein